MIRMHAILHDAAGFVREVYNTGPTYCYVLPRKCNSSLIGHLSGITFCLYIKLKKPKLYHLLEHIYSKRNSYNNFRLQWFSNFSTSS